MLRPRRHPRPPRRDGLDPEAREILLSGWSAPVPADAVADHDRFAVFELHDADLARLWRGHRAELLAEWQRRGCAGEPWAARFDAAAVRASDA